MQTRSSRGLKRENDSEDTRPSKAVRTSEQSQHVHNDDMEIDRPVTRSRSLQHSQNSTHSKRHQRRQQPENLDDDFDCSDLSEDSDGEAPDDGQSSHPLAPKAATSQRYHHGSCPHDVRVPCDSLRESIEVERLSNHQPKQTRSRPYNEGDARPSPDYMDRQTDIDSQMRGILVDWLVEVAEEYKLKAETLYLAVSIIDRVLDRMSVKKDELQLVGVSCMLIAAKTEEVYPPHVDDFVYISDNTYTRNQITKMESTIYNQLNLKIMAPTALSFVRRLQDIGRVDEEVIQLSNYLCELTLMEYSFLKYEPSMIAASAIALALWTVECKPWNNSLEQCSGFKLRDLTECLQALLNVFIDSGTGHLQAVREKYSAPNPHLCVANIPPPETIPSDTTATSPTPASQQPTASSSTA